MEVNYLYPACCRDKMSFNAMNANSNSNSMTDSSVDMKTMKKMVEEDNVDINAFTQEEIDDIVAAHEDIDTNGNDINAFTQEEIDDIVAAHEEYQRLLLEEDPNEYIYIYEKEDEDDPKNRRGGRY